MNLVFFFPYVSWFRTYSKFIRKPYKMNMIKSFILNTLPKIPFNIAGSYHRYLLGICKNCEVNVWKLVLTPVT